MSTSFDSISKIRNIGIAAHIDSGKTTLSERILYYAGRIHRTREVGVDGADGGATMDYMDLERERGITITSAATTVHWQDAMINLIDTPGHVDFTVEVERSLRVLDSAVLVLCAVGGVQAQSLTIDRQMRRYNVPRLAFINKMDRTGANPDNVVRQLREKLGCDAWPVEIPIGKEQNFQGVVDLIHMRAIYFDGDNGENVRYEEIPADLVEPAKTARNNLLEALSMYSDELMEKLLAEEEIDSELIYDVMRQALQFNHFTPVFMGTAYRNKGVQPLLDAIVRLLPSPADLHPKALEFNPPNREVSLSPDPTLPTVAMAFKIVEDPFGALTFMRVYQGSFRRGESYYNQRTGQKCRFSRIVRMHADQRAEIEEAGPGDIVAVLGLECASGDTFCSDKEYVTLQNMFVPEPVINCAIAPLKREGAARLSKALARFRREDPTLVVSTNEETGETIMAGMGELHLEVYVERIRREFDVEVEVSAPKVNYREAPTQTAPFDCKHKKQSGGSGQYAHIIGTMSVLTEEDSTDEPFLFEEHIVGGTIPKQYLPSIEKGFRSCLAKGPIAGFPVVNLKIDVTDGSYHEVDSSDRAFQTCAQTCMRETFPKTKPAILEPIMRVAVEIPDGEQGNVVGDLISRRGIVFGNDSDGKTVRIEAEVPLATMFGYASDLRGNTKGQGTFTMNFSRYKELPTSLAEDVIKVRREELRKK